MNKKVINEKAALSVLLSKFPKDKAWKILMEAETIPQDFRIKPAFTNLSLEVIKAVIVNIYCNLPQNCSSLRRACKTHYPGCIIHTASIASDLWSSPDETDLKVAIGIRTFGHKQDVAAALAFTVTQEFKAKSEAAVALKLLRDVELLKGLPYLFYSYKDFKGLRYGEQPDDFVVYRF